MTVVFLGIFNKNKTKRELSFLLDRNISLVSSNVDKVTAFIQERTSTVEKKYSLIAQKLEEVPELEEEINNDVIVHMLKDTFSIVSYIGKQKKLIEEKKKALYNSITISKKEMETQISSRKNLWTKGVCNTAFDRYNEKFNQHVDKIGKNILAFDKRCYQRISNMADLYNDYMAKTKQELSTYIDQKTLPVSKEVDRILSMAAEQETQLQNTYSQLHKENPEASEPGEKLNQVHPLERIKHSLAFYSYIEEQKRKNNKVLQDLADLINKTKEEIETFISSMKNLVIQDECEKALGLFNEKAGELMFNALEKILISNKSLDEYSEKIKTETLSYTTSTGNELLLNFDRTSLEKFKKKISQLENMDLLKLLVTEITTRIELLRGLENKALYPQKLSRTQYDLLLLVVNKSKNKNHIKYAKEFLNSVIKVRAGKCEMVGEDVLFEHYNIKNDLRKNFKFGCILTLSNRLPFEIDAIVLVEGHLQVEIVHKKLTGKEDLTAAFMGIFSQMLEEKTGIISKSKIYFETDEDINKAFPISQIPPNSKKTERITIWSGQNMSHLEYKGKLSNRSVKITFPP